jgi:threonyl-tRNA synthetase
VPGEQISVEGLKKVKKEMERIVKKNYPLVREEVSREEAR